MRPRGRRDQLGQLLAFLAVSRPCSGATHLSAEAAMKWNDMGRSSNIEDRRGSGVGRMGMGIGGTAVLLVLSLLFGRNLFEDVPATTTTSTGELAPADSAREEPEVRFVSFVLDDAQKTWANVLPKYGTPYRLSLIHISEPT